MILPLCYVSKSCFYDKVICKSKTKLKSDTSKLIKSLENLIGKSYNLTTNCSYAPPGRFSLLKTKTIMSNYHLNQHFIPYYIYIYFKILVTHLF